MSDSGPQVTRRQAIQLAVLVAGTAALSAACTSRTDGTASPASRVPRTPTPNQSSSSALLDNDAALSASFEQQYPEITAAFQKTTVIKGLTPGQQDVLLAVWATLESSLMQRAISGDIPNPSYGLFQFNKVSAAAMGKTTEELLDPEVVSPIAVALIEQNVPECDRADVASLQTASGSPKELRQAFVDTYDSMVREGLVLGSIGITRQCAPSLGLDTL